MKGYNIYFNGKQINSKVVSKNELNEIIGRQYIYKSNDNQNLIKIPINDIKIVECYVF